MEWRIREKHDGVQSLGWAVEKGMEIKSSKVGYKPGYYMPGFLVYEMYTFDTKEQAEAFIRKQTR